MPSLSAFEWTNTGPEGGYIISMDIAPGDTSIIYAGSYGYGIFKSDDGGLTWAQKSNGLPEWPEPVINIFTLPDWWFGDYYPTTTIQVHPLDSDRVWVGTNGGGVAYSSDGGQTWNLRNIGLLDSAFVNEMLMSPTNPSFFMAAVVGSVY